MKNACVVGYGAVGPIHAAAICKTAQGRLYAVCDVRPERAAACTEQYHIKAYTDFDVMLTDSAIDVIHICTPHYLHFEMIQKALAAGKEVVCEKPLTMTQAELEQLMALPDADRVCVVMQNRLNPCIVRLKALADSGEMGAVCAVKGIVTWCRRAEYYARDAWRGKWATEGGGVLINQTVHTLDLMGYIGGTISAVQAQMANFSLPEIEVEDTVSAHLSFAGGAAGVFFATNSYGDSDSPELEVIFEKGKVRYTDGKLFLNGEMAEEDSTPSIGKLYWGNGHRMLMENYYDRGSCFKPADVKNTMDAMFAMYESARQNGKRMTL